METFWRWQQICDWTKKFRRIHNRHLCCGECVQTLAPFNLSPKFRGHVDASTTKEKESVHINNTVVRIQAAVAVMVP